MSDIPQVSLSGAQRGVLQYVCDAAAPVPTGPYSNFKHGWVSGQVAAALVRKGLLRKVGTSVVCTAAGTAALSWYSENER